MPLQTDTPKIAIYLTNRCKLRCKHCFIEGDPQNDQFLTLAQIKTALRFFRPQIDRVEFTGGESCLSPELVPAIKEAKRLQYSVGINTNGTNPHLISLFNPKQVDKITFSLDGASAKTHDLLRGPGVFDRCLATMKLAIDKKFHTEAIFTVHKRNYTEVTKAIQLLDNLGIHRLSFNFISNQGTAILNQDLLLPPETWVKIRHLIDKQHPHHLALRYPVMFVTPTEFARLRRDTNYFCRLLNPLKTEIYPDGQIYHCCLVTSIQELSAGKVTDTQVIMDTSKERAFVQKYKHLSCPVHEVRKLYASPSRLIPLCLYYKYITPEPPQK